jgi:hypothetical protein
MPVVSEIPGIYISPESSKFVRNQGKMSNFQNLPNIYSPAGPGIRGGY